MFHCQFIRLCDDVLRDETRGFGEFCLVRLITLIDICDHSGHFLAHCFGCGEARRDGDAIRVLGGQLPGSGLSGSRWRAHENFADANGALAPRYVWTALDCTGGLAAQYLDPRPMLTGTMQVRIERPVMAGEEYAVLAWPIGQEGRKVITGTAIYDLSGTVQAVGRLIWITIPNY